MSPAYASVGVVGAGLIGGSVARRLHDLGVPVVVTDPDPATLDAARAAGLAVGDPVQVAACELVVLASPLDALGPLMGAVAAGRARVVVDVGSVKVTPALAAARAGLAERYVGLHPMGGTEASGFAHSDAGLLVGVTWAATYPVAAAAPLLAPLVTWLVETFAATVVVLDAEEHDRSVALVSHAPHVLAHALLELVEDADAPAAAHLAAGSFRDGTRVAGRNARRTLNMLADNAAALGPVLDGLVETLQACRDELDAPDDGRLAARLAAVAVAAERVRVPDVTWLPCPDLAALVGERTPAARPVLVRAAPGDPTALEWATP